MRRDALRITRCLAALMLSACSPADVDLFDASTETYAATFADRVGCMSDSDCGGEDDSGACVSLDGIRLACVSAGMGVVRLDAGPYADWCSFLGFREAYAIGEDDAPAIDEQWTCIGLPSRAPIQMRCCHPFE